jgi:hypothetical protein
MAELKPAGVHLVVVPLSEKPYLLRRWGSEVGRFTAIDFDCSLLPIFPQGEKGKPKLLLEGGDVLSAIEDIYGLEKGDGPLVVNSLGTLQAVARASGGERDWSRRFFKYVVYLSVACRARSDSSLFIVNSVREGGARDLLRMGWVRLCTSALDGTWVLSEDGLSHIP